MEYHIKTVKTLEVSDDLKPCAGRCLVVLVPKKPVCVAACRSFPSDIPLALAAFTLHRNASEAADDTESPFQPRSRGVGGCK